MSTPDSSATDSPRKKSLHVEAHGGKAVIRKIGDQDERERRFFGTVPAVPGAGVVLASATAVTDAEFLGALQEAFQSVLSGVRQMGRPPQVWAAVSGLQQVGPQGWSPAQRLADEFGVDVLVPDGPLALVPGGTIFAGTGGNCWSVFRRGAAARPFATRYPTPQWEAALPRATQTISGLAVEPVPAGLLLRPADSPHRTSGVGVAVPQSALRPRILLTPSITPEQAGAAIAALPPTIRQSVELVPTTAELAGTAWMQRLARLLGQPVFASAGTVCVGDDGGERALLPGGDGKHWAPYPQSMRHSPSGSQVISASAPPEGWVAAGPLLYRWGGSAQPEPGELLAKVVPAGLGLVTGDQASALGAADQLAFEPDRMTVAIGQPHTELSAHAPEALARLLGGLTAQQRQRTRLLVLGTTDERVRSRVRGVAGDLAARLQFPGVSTAPVAAGPPNTGAPGSNAEQGSAARPATGDASAPPTGPQPPKAGSGAARPPTGGPPAARPAVASDAAPPGPTPPTAQPTPSSHPPAATPGIRPNPQRPRPGAAPQGPAPSPARATQGAAASGSAAPEAKPAVAPPLPANRPVTSSTDPAEPPTRKIVTPAAEAVPTRGSVDTVRTPVPNGSPEAAAAEAQDAPPEPPAVELLPATPPEPKPADHSSSAEERSRFAHAAGVAFDEALPSVNTALASFPALRDSMHDQDAKADFVAVHLYLGSGAHGANAINAALRGGDGNTHRDTVACLTSGLRRLPVHRGASFRAARVRDGQSPLPAYEPGAVLAEPGFLSATAASDMTIDQAHVDVVIWSHSARRTAALGQGLPEEVVFDAATRFKVLAVESAEQDGETSPAVLMRELRPGESVEAGIDEFDESVLPRLRRALSRRQSSSLQVLGDDDQAGRFAEPLGLVLGERSLETARRANTAEASQAVPAGAH